jgi:hypothetical protein
MKFRNFDRKSIPEIRCEYDISHTCRKNIFGEDNLY